MTSLTFMFDWVPEPVCQTESGNSASSCPPMTSSAARTIRSATSGASLPASAFTSAAAFFSVPKACATSSGIGSSPIGKWCRERCVCAPQ